MSIPPVEKLDIKRSVKDIAGEVRKKMRFYARAFRLPINVSSDQSITHDWGRVKTYFNDRFRAFLRSFSHPNQGKETEP